MFAGNIGLVVLGLFVLVWVISAVVKATQRPAPPARNNNRQRPTEEDQPDRATNNEIDRFMAELDRLRTKGDGAKPKGQGGQPRGNRPRPQGQRGRAEPGRAAAPVPPPLPPVLPVLPPLPQPLAPISPSMAAPPPPPPPPEMRAGRLARTAKLAAPTVLMPSPVLQTLQALMRSKQGPAAAVILAEIFSEPRCRKPLTPPHKPS